MRVHNSQTERRTPAFAQPSLGDELRRLRQASEHAASLAGTFEQVEQLDA
jgi:hypothetical protein